MINFSMGVFWTHLSLLHYELSLAKATAERTPEAPVPVAQAKRTLNNLQGIFRQCAELQLESCDRTIIKIEQMDLVFTRYADLAKNLERLREDIEHDIKQEYFFHYSKDGANSIHTLPQKWGGIYQAFKASKPEIEAGVDCLALGHYTASVFYMCRVAEIGLRAIGIERGVTTVKGSVPIEWGTWGQVFQAIEPKIEDIKLKPNGPQKDAALAFYQQVLADLRAMHSYRDPAMHFHSSYEIFDAQKAMFRTHTLMEKLATKLSDQTVGEIPWSAWP